eukprot:GCRY01000304.1.p1 GENE.GCRY01000304.1~~GCRY01000304.1.p1  ORF type:complete len:304 (+),score=89.63 GCRY01000304.1:60-971(+)
MSVVIATEKPFAAAARDEMVKMLEGAGLKVTLLEKYSAKADLIKACSEHDAVIIRSDIIDEEVMAAAPNLKLVVRAGAGTDNVAVAVKEKIVVENTPGQNSNAVAELAFGMMVMMARNQYNGKSGWELKGKRLGLQAFGAVGKCMATLAQGFGMEVAAFDPFLPDDQFAANGVIQVKELEELYKTCDVVSLHIPSTPQTRGSINYDLLKLMKKKGILVNTARVDVIDEESVIKALKENPGLAYTTDVAPKNLEGFKALGEQFFATPKKMGAQTEEANINAGLAAARQVIAFLKEQKVMFQVKK